MRTASSRLPHVARTGIRVAEHRDRAIAKRLRGADDAARDLAAIGDQDFVERGHDVRSLRRATIGLAAPHRSLHLHEPGRLALLDERLGAFAALGAAHRRGEILGRIVEQFCHRGRTRGAQHQPFGRGDRAGRAGEHLVAGVAHRGVERGGVRDREMGNADRAGLGPARRAPETPKRRAAVSPMRLTTKGEIAAGTTPILTSLMAKTASAVAMVMSATQARPKPPPMAKPSTAAITACGAAFTVSIMVPKRRLFSLTSSVAARRRRRAGGRKILDVGAGAKRAAGPAQHHDAHRPIVRDRRERREDLRDHLLAQSVAHLRPVEPQLQHRAAQIEPDMRGRAADQAWPAFCSGALEVPGSVPISLQMMLSMTSSAPPPIEPRRPSR